MKKYKCRYCDDYFSFEYEALEHLIDCIPETLLKYIDINDED